MQNYSTSLLEKDCRGLIKAFKGRLSWKWDGRFETVLAEFSTKDKASVQQSIQAYMGNVWTDANFKSAPGTVQMLITVFGGLNVGQQLFSSDPGRDDLLVCAWWPWGNGRTISIRVGVFGASLSDEENEELTRLFRGWFGL